MAASIKKNYVYNTLLTFLNILYPVLSFAYVSRILGPHLLGKVNIALSFAGYFVLVACIGIPTYGTREIAKVRDNGRALSKTFTELFTLNFLSTFIALLLYCTIFLSIDKWRSDSILFFAAGLSVLSNIISVDWFYQGTENYRYISLRNAIVRTLSLLTIFLVIKQGSNYLIYVIILSLSTIISNLFAIHKTRSFIKFDFQAIDLKKHFRPLLFISGSILMAAVYNNLDSVLLGFLSGDAPVGLYATAIKINKLLIPIVTSIGVVLIPRFSYYFNNNLQSEIANLSRRSITFIFFFAFPLTTIILVLAPQIVSILAGNRFSEAVLATSIISPIILVIGCSNFLGMQLLFPSGKENIVFYSTLAAAIVNFSLNIWLIPIYKQNATAFSLVCAESTVLAVQYFYLRYKNPGFRLFDIACIRYGLLSTLCGTAIFPLTMVVKKPLLCFCIAGCLFALLYGGSLLVLRDTLINDIRYIIWNRIFPKSMKKAST